MIFQLERTKLQVLCALIWCIVSAGPVFGFAALKPVLIAQGVYHEKCQQETLFSGSSPCANQDLSLNYLFTLSAVVTNGASLIVGAILDKYGPKVSGIIGAILLFIASLVMSNGYWLMEYFDAYLIGYSILALGGPFVFISCFHLANAFPKNSGLVLALLTGAFDSSSALFLIYRFIFFSNLGEKFNLSLKTFFSFYMIVPVYILLCQTFILPSESYSSSPMQKLDNDEIADIDEESALIDAPVADCIDEYLPIQIPSNGPSDLLNTINESLSRSLQSPSQNILTDQYAHSRSNSFNQRVISSRSSFARENNLLLNANNQLVNDAVFLEESDQATKNQVADIHKTINQAISSEIHKNTNHNLDNSLASSVILDSVSIIEQTKADEEMAYESGIDGTLHGASLKEQVGSIWFLLMALFTSIQMLRINYFVATVRSQEEFLLGDPLAAKKVNEFFDLALPIGGLLSIPFIGTLLDNFRTVTILSILLGVSLIIGIMGMIPNATANYIGIMFMVLYRPFYYTAVSDYCAKVFGFTTFGTIYGAIICISGLFNFVQTGLDNLTHITFGMNPIPVNLLLTSLTAIIGGVLIFFVKNHKKPKKNVLIQSDQSNYGSIEQ